VVLLFFDRDGQCLNSPTTPVLRAAGLVAEINCFAQTKLGGLFTNVLRMVVTLQCDQKQRGQFYAWDVNIFFGDLGRVSECTSNWLIGQPIVTSTFFERSCPNDNELREVNIGEENLYQRAYSQVLTKVSCR